jgi:hypothetical protein
VARTKKRPDGYVVLPNRGDEAGGATMVMFDFTVVHVTSLKKHFGTNPITRARGHKIRKYSKLLRHVRMAHDEEDDAAAGGGEAVTTVRLGPEVAPVLMVSFGFFDKQSVAFLERVGRIASRPGFVAGATAAVQVRVLNSQASGVTTSEWRVRAREAAGQSVRVRVPEAAGGGV